MPQSIFPGFVNVRLLVGRSSTISGLTWCCRNSRTARRANLPDVTKQVPHFVPSKIRGRGGGQARLGLGLGKAPPFLIQGLAAPASSTTGTGTKGDQCLNQHQRATPRSRAEEERAGQPLPPPPSPPPPPRPRASDAPSQRFPPVPRPESPLAHARRGAAHNVPPAVLETSPAQYTLSIALPRPGGALLASEMITVSARRGGRLAVVADAWHLERDCKSPFLNARRAPRPAP